MPKRQKYPHTSIIRFVWQLYYTTYFLVCKGEKQKRADYNPPSFESYVKLLRFLSSLCNNLYTLVVAASLAYTVSKINLATLGALYKVGGSFKLPNAGTSFHFSRMRNLSLWYCHFEILLCESANTHSRTMLFFIIHFIKQFLKRSESWVNVFFVATAITFVQILAAFLTKP